MFGKVLICLLPLALFVSAKDVVVKGKNFGGDLNVSDQETPLELKDIVISDNTVGGDINVNANGHGGSNGGGQGGQTPDTEPETFGDGCEVAGDTVKECDGTQRLLTRVEKKKVTARIARRQRQRKTKGASRARTNRSKTRRDLEEGDEEESPCQTCSTGASYAKKNKRKNNRKH